MSQVPECECIEKAGDDVEHELALLYVLVSD